MRFEFEGIITYVNVNLIESIVDLPVALFGLAWPWSPWKLTVNLKQQRRAG